MVPLLWGLLLAAAGPMLSASFEMRPKEEVSLDIFCRGRIFILKLALPSPRREILVLVLVKWFMYLANASPAINKFAGDALAKYIICTRPTRPLPSRSTNLRRRI